MKWSVLCHSVSGVSEGLGDASELWGCGHFIYIGLIEMCL